MAILNKAEMVVENYKNGAYTKTGFMIEFAHAVIEGGNLDDLQLLPREFELPFSGFLLKQMDCEGYSFAGGKCLPLSRDCICKLHQRQLAFRFGGR